MMANDINVIDAYSYVRSCRQIISPNIGFIMQLVNFWKARHRSNLKRQNARQISRRYYTELQIDKIDYDNVTIKEFRKS